LARIATALAANHMWFDMQVVKDAYNRPVLLFKNEYAFKQVDAEQGEKLGELSPYALPPEN
jgi:peptide chain release factor 3